MNFSQAVLLMVWISWNYSQEVLRKNIGLVLHPFLYHGTIKSNIAMYQDLSDEEVQAAAAFVRMQIPCPGAHRVMMHPRFERGSSFSTGQRQLAFARTASQPKTDFGWRTANIDLKQKVWLRFLAKMRQGRTTIAIAHRRPPKTPTTYVLDKGRIIEEPMRTLGLGSEPITRCIACRRGPCPSNTWKSLQTMSALSATSKQYFDFHWTIEGNSSNHRFLCTAFFHFVV